MSCEVSRLRKHDASHLSQQKGRKNTQQRDRRGRLLLAGKATVQSRANRKTNCEPAFSSREEEDIHLSLRLLFGFFCPGRAECHLKVCLCACILFQLERDKIPINHMVCVFVQKQSAIIHCTHLCKVCLCLNMSLVNLSGLCRRFTTSSAMFLK